MSDIKSRPIWGRISPVENASGHLVCSEGAQAGRQMADIFGTASKALARTTILNADIDRDADVVHRLSALDSEACLHFPTRQTLMISLKAHLARLHMGTQIYFCGPEAFLGEAVALAESFGALRESLQTQLCGAHARRVQCVHCKGFIEDVSESPIVCAHCGVNLMVRDHYSRRLGAYMGVCVDAEAPGELPAPERF